LIPDGRDEMCVEATAIASWLLDDGLQVDTGLFNCVETVCNKVYGLIYFR
jgi:hypothetical protein